MAWSARTRLYRPPCKSPKDVTRRRDGRLRVTSPQIHGGEAPRPAPEFPGRDGAQDGAALTRSITRPAVPCACFGAAGDGVLGNGRLTTGRHRGTPVC